MLRALITSRRRHSLGGAMALAILASPPTPPPAADETPLIAAIEAPEPAARAAPPSVIEAARLGMDEAAALASRLADEVLSLRRLARLQETLLAVNTERAKLGAAPIALPGDLCQASPLGAMCALFPETFAAPPGETP